MRDKEKIVLPGDFIIICKKVIWCTNVERIRLKSIHAVN